MQKNTGQSIYKTEIKLTKEEASELSRELTLQLRMGQIPQADSKKIELIIAGLGDQRGLLRRTFAESLGVIGKAAIPALVNALLYHPNLTVRRASAKALKLVGDSSALPALLQALLTDEDTVVQCSAVGAMAIFGEEAVEHLLKVLTDQSSSAMQCGLATWGLSFIGAEAPEALRKAAESNNDLIRAAAISSLGEQIKTLEDKIAKHLVLRALYDSSNEVRIAATSLLGNLDDPYWVNPLLIRKLSDENSEVRSKAALSLMKSKAEEIIDPLQNALSKEKDQKVLKILNLAISQIKSKSSN